MWILSSSVSDSRSARSRTGQDCCVQLSRGSRVEGRYQRVLVSPFEKGNLIQAKISSLIDFFSPLSLRIAIVRLVHGLRFLKFTSKESLSVVATSCCKCINRENWRKCWSRLNWSKLNREQRPKVCTDQNLVGEVERVGGRNVIKLYCTKSKRIARREALAEETTEDRRLCLGREAALNSSQRL